MGNTPSNQHGSPRHPSGSNHGNGHDNRSGSSRHPNLRLPMPPANPNNISPTPSNPASPSGRSGSPRRRKSLELPDLNKLSFTPAAPVPTTATHTSHHLAPSTSAGRSTSPNAPSGSKRWQNVLGGARSPLTPGFGAMSKLDSNATATTSQSPTKATNKDPSTSPTHSTSTNPYFPAEVAKPIPTTEVTGNTQSDGKDGAQADDGLVAVEVQWTGAGKNVYLAGDFADNWKEKIQMIKSDGVWTATLRLKPGQHRMKFVVDDSWRCSKEIPTATDEDGTFVNWIEVEAPKTEAQAKDAWPMDAAPPAKDIDNDDDEWTTEIPEAIVLYQYIEELPHMFQHQNGYRSFISEIPHLSPVPQPPVLPRLLEKVIVNHDPLVGLENRQLQGWDHISPAGLDDNSILAVPNHVVLNHLTASAMRNGVLGVGTTTRYRKKYITTMFFKPSTADLKGDEPAPAPAQTAGP